jgi:hypothetical protein
LQQQIADQPLRLDQLPTDRRVQLARTRKERFEGFFEHATRFLSSQVPRWRAASRQHGLPPARSMF